MLILDKAGTDKLLLQLEKQEAFDSRYQFCKVDGGLELLGTGGFSSVYEMYDSVAPKRHYAMKIIGLGEKTADEDFIFETTQIQYFLGEQSENVMRIINLWIMKVHLDETGNVTGITGVNEEEYEEAGGIPVQLVLMEKLDPVLLKDKYGNVEVLREDLKSEEEVLRLAKDIGSALSTAHENGIIHRDVKLENIFWDEHLQQYKLGDFGVARYVENGDAETVVFTDGYGAPEIERHLTEAYDLTVDIYSFGISLFLLMNGLKFPASDEYRSVFVQYSKDFIMPAVLKASFERAYVRHGWDLNRSVYIDKGNGKFPDFKDVLEILPVILNESDFSADTKGDYIGSLVTRVESLTNGLVGQIFNGNPVDDEILFDQNTIVDLSRVGSTETKALIMGVLVLKLSEYRQSTSKGVNLPLHHVTIMEEAHNLLKRTSTEQGQESANVQGKSVEMISNSIAEMRTYGEGFIIVDQSPTAVDISAIKNTNTKIVMRLPEASDCEAAGHSIGLKDEQIMELGKLDKGVAAVFQNDWLETVLTKIDKCSDKYEVSGVKKNDIQAEKDFLGELLEELVRQAEDNTCNLPWLKDIVKKAKIDNSKKHMLEKMIDEYHTVYTTAITVENKREAYNELIAKLLNCADLIRMYETDLPAGILKKSQMTDEIQKAGTNWIKRISAGLESYATFWDRHIKNQVLFSVILNEMKNSKRLNQYKVVLYCAKHYKC